MVQAMNTVGSVNRVGMSENGRAIYQMQDGNGNVAGKISIPQEQCDVFEKSYKDLIETAPKMQKYAEKYSSEDAVKKLKKTASWTVGISTALGAGIGIFATRKIDKFWKQSLITLGTSFAGLVGGMALSKAMVTPSGASKFTKAAQNISQLDIQPVNDQTQQPAGTSAVS